MATPVSPSFYADFQSLDRLKASAQHKDPQALREAARQFESLLTNMMLKSMREANLGEGMGDSDETKTYQDMYDQQLSLQIAHGKGLGLADMLVQQLSRSNASGQATQSGTVSGPSSPSTSTISSGTAPSKVISSAQRAAFVRSIDPLAQAASKTLGVAPDTLIAQAALETGWGRSMATDASGQNSNNLFGIKAGAAWSGGSLVSGTTEYVQGAATSTRAAFRSYDSPEQSVKDYVSLLQGSSRYAGALGTGSNVHAFGSALSRGGYATDPDYVSKLVATADSVRQLRASALKS